MWMADPVGERTRVGACGNGACAWAALFVTTLAVATAGAVEGTKATITGGSDASGHQYSWTVTNKHSSPIVRVEFPHYRAGLFFAPDGWSTDESTFLVGVGVKNRAGVCIAQVTSPADTIAPGDSATFRMQIAGLGVQRRPGTVLLSFADGSEAAVSGVELPTRAGIGERYLSLIGLGTIFVVAVVIRGFRARRRSKDSSLPASPPQAEG